MNKKLGQESAFPTNYIDSRNAGMSKRFYAACAAMKGILASSDLNNLQYSFEQVIPKLAFMYADELLKQENE